MENGLLIALPDLMTNMTPESDWTDTQDTFLIYILELVESQKNDLNNILKCAPTWVNQLQLNELRQ